MFKNNRVVNRLCWLVINLMFVTSLLAWIPVMNSAAVNNKDTLSAEALKHSQGNKFQATTTITTPTTTTITPTTTTTNPTTTTTNPTTTITTPTNTLAIDVKKDFGVKGDGITNDTANIQKALNNGSGKSVYFSAGTYLVTSALTFPSNISIYGDGFDKSKFITTSGSVFSVSAARQSVKISDLSFIGNKTGASCLINLDSMTDLLIQNCYFEKPAISCVQIQNSSNVTVKNCTATDGGWNGSWGGGLEFSAVNGLTVEGCNLYNNAGSGINITGACSNFHVLSNSCLGNKVVGITITGNSYNGEVIGNTCNNNGTTTSGMQDGINGHRLKNVLISNNTCNNNAYNGISMDGSDGIGNTSGQYITIVGNTCTGNKGQGIYLYYTQYCTVDNNTCLKNECTKGTLGGIALERATYNKVINNRSHDSGVVGGIRCSDIYITATAGNNTLEKNAIGSIDRADEQNDITVRSTNNYIGAVDYTHFKWGVTTGKTPILIADLFNQQYSTDIVKTVESKEFTLSNVTGEDNYIFLNAENARIIDSQIIYTEATSSNPGVNIMLGTSSNVSCFGIKTTEISKGINTSTPITLTGDKKLSAGTQLRVHLDNKKTGTGKVKVKVRLMIPIYYGY